MKTLEMQFTQGGEFFEIWHTKAETLEDAWNEIDSDIQPANGGHVRFSGETDIMVVNGGF